MDDEAGSALELDRDADGFSSHDRSTSPSLLSASTSSPSWTSASAFPVVVTLLRSSTLPSDDLRSPSFLERTGCDPRTEACCGDLHT